MDVKGVDGRHCKYGLVVFFCFYILPMLFGVYFLKKSTFKYYYKNHAKIWVDKHLLFSYPYLNLFIVYNNIISLPHNKDILWITDFGRFFINQYSMVCSRSVDSHIFTLCIMINILVFLLAKTINVWIKTVFDFKNPSVTILCLTMQCQDVVREESVCRQMYR